MKKSTRPPRGRQNNHIDSEFLKRLNHDVVINKEETIINTWYHLKDTFPRIFPVYIMIMTVPSSQADVECAFSALKLFLSELRKNLSDEIINKLLFLKLNGYDDDDFTDEIYEKKSNDYDDE